MISRPFGNKRASFLLNKIFQGDVNYVKTRRTNADYLKRCSHHSK